MPGQTDHGRRRLTRPEAQALTRRRLLAAVGDVLCERGFRAASLTDVADRAGYTIGAVYSNFASKDEVFHALMRERLKMAEDGLAAAFHDDQPSAMSSTDSVEDRIELELDRMVAAEDAVPPRWWRLLYEYRAHAATNPAAWAELSDSDRRCREIVARHIERFAANVGVVLPVSAIEAAELSMALTDGLRAAHAEGRSTFWRSAPDRRRLRFQRASSKATAVQCPTTGRSPRVAASVQLLPPRLNPALGARNFTGR